MSGDTPVTSPDQRRPGFRRAGYAGAVIVALTLLSLTIGNHTVGGRGRAENLVLVVIATGLILTVVVDWILRRNGLRS